MTDMPFVRQLIKQHRSIRQFQRKPIPQAVIDELIACAQSAPTSHNVQAYSVICVRNQETKKQLQMLCGDQPYIGQCPVFFVLVMDFYRHAQLSESHQTNFEIAEIENILVGSVDTALFSQNLLLAAQSYGLGGVMIGGIRNEPDQVAKLLNLPKYTFPLMGMCIGYPDQNPWQKPRLPQLAVYHEEVYQLEHLASSLDTYEQITEHYYRKRTKGKKTNGWGRKMSNYFKMKRRQQIEDFLKEQGFLLE